VGTGIMAGICTSSYIGMSKKSVPAGIRG